MRVKLLIAVLVAVVVSFVVVGAATAVPLTQSQPFQAVCEAQGGGFASAPSPYPPQFVCVKQGFLGFTPTQVAVQQTLCEQVYGGTYWLETLPNDPGGTYTFAAHCY